MSVRCVALLSGGLDSMLAIRIMQLQGIEVEALNFQTVFTCCRDEAGQVAKDMGVRLTVIGQADDYLELVRKPRFGYGRGANPCVDCRIYMFARAKRFMDQIKAEFVVSGEVVGQRPMSQKRRDLDVIAHHSQLEDLLLRPLSAKLLPRTLPERKGVVDRERLYDFSGRSRKGIISLARQLGFQDTPSPSTGCALTEVGFSRKVFDLIEFDPAGKQWDFELLRVGRHFRLDGSTKVIVGRNEEDNQRLCYLFSLPDHRQPTLLEPQRFPGPVVMIVGPSDAQKIDTAIGLMLQHSRSNTDFEHARIKMTQGRESSLIRVPRTAPTANVRNVTESARDASLAG